MKNHVEAFAYAGHICNAMKKGVLLTTKAGETVNSMTIGWGMIGIEWNKPVFIVFVRESRYTKQLLEENGEFTINIPLGEIDSRILGYCGTKSGRDTDKIRDLGLTLVPGEKISVPGIRELPLTLECRVIYKQKQEISILSNGICQRFYPAQEGTESRDGHIAYYGEILDAYIIEP